MKKYAKTTLCMALSAAMLFTSTGITVLAEESVQADETQQEVQAEETLADMVSGEEEITEEAPVREETTEQVSENRGTDEGAWESDLTERNYDESNVTEDEDVQDTSSEEEFMEKTEFGTASNEKTVSEDSTDMEEIDMVSETETKAEESENKLLFSNTDIANGKYEENGNNITWAIDKDGKLVVEGTGDFARTGVAFNQGRAPWYVNRNDIILAQIKVSDMTDASCMFYGCMNLKEVDFSDFNTSSLTNMQYMFQDCGSLTSLDLSKFDTSNVTRINSMFCGCSSLTNLDLGAFDTSKVSGSMESMFRDCSKLTNLDLGSFNTSHVTDMACMFESCSSLEVLDLSSFDVRNVTSMQSMFILCRNLKELNLSSFSTGSVTSMRGMFSGCDNLQSLDISNFNTCNVMDMRNMFARCRSLKNLDLKGFNTRNVENMKGMFYFCTSLINLDLSSFNTSNVIDMEDMFGECRSLKNVDISNFDTCKVESINNMFYGCNSLESLDLSSFDMSRTNPDASYLSYCTAVSYIYTPYNLTSSVTLPNDSKWYDNAGKQYNELPKNLPFSILLTKGDAPTTLEGYIAATKERTSYNTDDTITDDDLTVIYYASDGTVKELNAEDYTTNIIEIDSSKPGIHFLSIQYQALKTKVKLRITERTHGEYKEDGNDITWSIDSEGNLLVEGTGDFASDDNNKNRAPWYSHRTEIKFAKIIVNEAVNISGMFYGCSNLKSVDLSAFDTSKVTNMGYMFYGCSSLKSLNLNKLDTSKVTNMSDMFYSCSALTNLDISNFDTRNVVYMSNMFYDCSSLTNLDVSHFNTSKVYGMTCMFYGCSSLKSLDVSHFDTGYVHYMNCMFEGCSALTNIDISNFNTGNVENMIRMFGSCSSVTNIDMDTLVTSKVSNMREMFRDCNSLESLDVTGFDTSNVTDMSNMFNGCNHLTNLNVSAFNTRNVTSMEGMFYGCSSLTDLDLSNFNLSEVTSVKNMLNNCNNLLSIYTLCNLKESVLLPSGDWYDMSEKAYTELPKELSYSILLAKGAKPTTSTERIAAIKEKTSYNVGDTVNTDDLTVRYYGSDGTVKILDAKDYTVSKADTSTAGVKTLTVTYKSFTAEMKLTVAKKEESGGTEESSSAESSKTEESSFVEESSKTEESSSVEESSKTEESSSTEESSKAEESSSVEESSKTEESSSTEESSTEDKDDSPYEDSERTDLKSASAVIANIKAKVYDGNAYEPVVKVAATVDGKKITLTEGADYRVLYKNNVNAGTGTIIIRGNGEYKGEITKDFTISQKPVKKLKVLTGGISGVGSLQTCPVYVYDGTKLLQSGKDYTLSDYTAVKANSAQVTVKAVESGNYTGAVVAKLTVYEEGTKIISPENVKLKETAVAYTGKAVKPEVTVTVDNAPLTNKDYKVQYQNNKDAGTAYIIVTGKGAYKGKAVVPFTIKTETIDKPNDFTIKEIKAATYNGKLQKPAVSVSIQKNGKARKLSKKDYTVTYKNNLHAGEATVTVTGKGNYAGLSATAKFTINPQQIKKASLKGTQGNLVLMYSKRKLKEGTDYEKPEYGAVNKNKVSVTIKGKGDFTGEITKNVKVQ